MKGIVRANNVDLAPSWEGESPYNCPELDRKLAKTREGIKSLFGQGNVRVGLVLEEDLETFGGFVQADGVRVGENILIGRDLWESVEIMRSLVHD